MYVNVGLLKACSARSVVYPFVLLLRPQLTTLGMPGHLCKSAHASVECTERY